jgi:hypothetical protein
MGNMMRDLQDIADEISTPEQRQRQCKVGRVTYFRVDNTSRSSDAPPLRAPHNFGICKTWYEEKRRNPYFKMILADWYRFPGPNGWDTDNREDEEIDTAEASATGPDD